MSYREVSKLLKEHWFYIKRQTWSHVIFKSEQRTVIVPHHWWKDIPWPTINSILKQAWLK